MAFQQWTLFYLIPAALAVFLASRQKSLSAKLIVIHVAIVLSILFLSFTGAKIFLNFKIYPLVLAFVSSIFAVFLLKRLGFIYIISSILQEWCLLLAASLLGFEFGAFWASCATALVFSLSHVIDSGHWKLKLFLALFWGISSIFLYYFLKEPMLNFAIHIAGGAILIHKGFLYEKLDRFIRSSMFNL